MVPNIHKNSENVENFHIKAKIFADIKIIRKYLENSEEIVTNPPKAKSSENFARGRTFPTKKSENFKILKNILKPKYMAL